MVKSNQARKYIEKVSTPLTSSSSSPSSTSHAKANAKRSRRPMVIILVLICEVVCMSESERK